MQNAVININGDIFTPPEAVDKAKVSVFDRSYLYGDSLYEVVRSYQGQLYLIDDHLQRLAKSAKLCHMTLAQTTGFFADEIYRTFESFKTLPGNQNTEAYARLIVSRGVGRIGFGLSCLATPSQYTIIVQPVEAPSASDFEAGMRLQLSERLRNHPKALDPAMKSGNYLNSLLAYLEATSVIHPKTGKPRFQDALLCDAHGHVTEGTTFNIFYVRRGIVATPPLEIGILDGVTRRKVIELAETNGIPVRKVRFPGKRLLEADEVFISSSIREVFPVTDVNGRKISNGKPGPITRQLRQLYERSVQEASYLGPV